MIFDYLSEAQVCALEDAAVRMGLKYDESQGETQEELAVQKETPGTGGTR